MSVRLWAGVGALVAGCALLAAAQVAGASSSEQVLRVGVAGSSVQIDPQLAYDTTSWWLEDATGATLLTWSPTGTLVRQAAAGYRVADGGRAYGFVVRAAMRFSDGSPVTASSFAYAIRRLRSRVLDSPGAGTPTASGGSRRAAASW
jgi:ABC-type oligopeptide transport system substrate-binding subunit